MNKLFIVGDIINNEGSISDDLFEILISRLVFARTTDLHIEKVILADGNLDNDEVPPKMNVLCQTLIDKKKKGSKYMMSLRVYNCAINKRLDFLDFKEKAKKLKIESITLQELKISDEEIEALIFYTSNLKNLKALSIQHNSISTKGVIQILENSGKFPSGISIFAFSNKGIDKKEFDRSELNEYITKRKEEGKSIVNLSY